MHVFQGPDPLSGDEPARIFGRDITDEERRKLVLQAYEHLKTTFQKFKKPDGQKNFPGKTCRDIWAAYPESPSGTDLSMLDLHTFLKKIKTICVLN